MIKKGTAVRSLVICLLVFILGGVVYRYYWPRYQLKNKGYEEAEIEAILALEDEGKIFLNWPKVNHLANWMSLSDDYERYQAYQTYALNHEDVSDENVVAVIDLIEEHPDLFVFSSQSAKDTFLKQASFASVWNYYQQMDSGLLNQNYEQVDVLVQEDAQLSISYQPADLELCAIPNADGSLETMYLRKEANEALEKMADAAKEEGYFLVNNSSYRSFFAQEEIYAYYLDLYGQKYCDQYVGKPGLSEHQTGLAIDLSSASVENGDYFVFGESPDYDWVVDHCVAYGFILRYPKDKVEITQVANEPWHFRYVGKEAAQIMAENNWCLEEYHQAKGD